MATSGSFDTGNTGGIGANYPKRATYSWWINSQSIANNTTSIGYKLVLGGGESSYSSIATYGCSTSTDGEGKSFDGGGTFYGNGKELISGTKTITHNADGTKAFGASATINLYWPSGHSVSGSGSWDLPTIARQAYLSTAPASFDDTANPTITYTNAAGNAVSSLQACIASPDGSTIYAAYRNVNKTGTLSYTFNLTAAERNALLAACPSSNTLSVKFWLKTVIGSTTFYDTKAATMNVVSANPTFSNYTYSDTNSTITAITGNNQVLVAGKSNLSVVISSANKAVANKQATMSSYVASLSGKTVSANYSSSGNTLNFSSNDFSTGTQTLSVKATDSRGNYTAVNKNVTVVGYSDPVINVVATRLNNFENETTFTFSGSISPITVGGTRKNDLVGNVQYRYKNQNTSTWGSWTNLTASVASDGTLTINNLQLSLANNSSWDMQVKAQDKLATTTTSIVIGQGQPQFFVGDDGRVAIGGTPSISLPSGKSGQLEVKGNAYAEGKLLMTLDRVYPVGSIFISTAHTTASAVATALGGGTWQAWGKGRVPIGMGSNGTTNYTTVEATGGEEKHTLTTSEMPSHHHTYANTSGKRVYDVRFGVTGWGNTSSLGAGFNGGVFDASVYGGDTGGGGSHNNMQPYITVYMWKRTA